MKLAEHTLLSLRCEMTQLGYRWKRYQSDRSLRWDRLDHWELWTSAADSSLNALVLRPVVTCGGDLITTDIACTVWLGPDQSLGRWELSESYVGSSKEIDPSRFSLEDLPKLLAEWLQSWDAGERDPFP